jgi:hypothetical protein
MTAENLVRQRTKTMAHLSLKHISLLGVVRLKCKSKKKKINRHTKHFSQPTSSGSYFLFDKAVEDAQFEEDDEDAGADDDDDDEDCDEDVMYNEFGDLIDNRTDRGMSESEEDSDTDDEDQAQDAGDISELVIQESEVQADEPQLTEELFYHDHNYASYRKGHFPKVSCPKTKSGVGKRARYKYSFLFSVVISGVCKKIKNSIPNAVATLSNSKTIILGHIHHLLDCLDPALAELCYIDTDSCIWSFTHRRLEDNLRSDKVELWKSLDIIADEQADQSCHGKLKLEGTFKVGLFKALKIYRLFSTHDLERERKEKTCYTRCKGVNRNIAKIIPNAIFDKHSTNKVVVHRSCLRPSRTGEMLIAHECKSLAAPFNLKRYVTDDGIHTFPISFTDGSGEQAF